MPTGIVPGEGEQEGGAESAGWTEEKRFLLIQGERIEPLFLQWTKVGFFLHNEGYTDTASSGGSPCS